MATYLYLLHYKSFIYKYIKRKYQKISVVPQIENLGLYGDVELWHTYTPIRSNTNYKFVTF